MSIPHNMMSAWTLVRSAMLDVYEVSPAAIFDYGVTTESFAYYQEAIRGGVTIEQLHESCGNGPNLSKLISENIGEDVSIITKHD